MVNCCLTLIIVLIRYAPRLLLTTPTRLTFRMFPSQTSHRKADKKLRLCHRDPRQRILWSSFLIPSDMKSFTFFFCLCKSVFFAAPLLWISWSGWQLALFGCTEISIDIWLVAYTITEMYLAPKMSDFRSLRCLCNNLVLHFTSFSPNELTGLSTICACVLVYQNI